MDNHNLYALNDAQKAGLYPLLFEVFLIGCLVGTFM